jgi:Lrp/AsnC family leucine-responsive transcriptional regulator
VSGETGLTGGAQALNGREHSMRTVLEEVGGSAAFISEVSEMVGSEAHPPYLRGEGRPRNLAARDRSHGLKFAFVEDVDRSIVRLLSEDGRRSFTDLSRETGLSVSAVHQRVRRLEQRGVIRGYRTVADPVALGLPLTAFVSIKPIDPSAPDDAPEKLEHLSAIEACHSVAGEESYILKVRVPTPGDLELLLQEIRAAANVSTRTTVVLSTPFEDRPFGL